jgi:hypothetical protein
MLVMSAASEAASVMQHGNLAFELHLLHVLS